MMHNQPSEHFTEEGYPDLAEFKKALVPVLGFSQTLLRHPEIDSHQRQEFLSRIEEGAQRLKVLTTHPRNRGDYRKHPSGEEWT